MCVWGSKGGWSCLKTGVLRLEGGFGGSEMGVYLWNS